MLPDADASELATKLQRFVFRSKVKLEARDDLHAIGQFARPTNAAGSDCRAMPLAAWKLDLGGDVGRAACASPPFDAAPDEALASPAGAPFDLQHGLPRLADQPTRPKPGPRNSFRWIACAPSA